MMQHCMILPSSVLMSTVLPMVMKQLLAFPPSNAMVTPVPADVAVPPRNFHQNLANMPRAPALTLLTSVAFAVLPIQSHVAGMFSVYPTVSNQLSTASSSCLRQKKDPGSPVIVMLLL
jgi:hypothetical protein